MAVLAMVCDDYESPGTITADLCRELGTPIDVADVGAALESLVSKELVGAYCFDSVTGNYLPKTASMSANTFETWFLASRAGRGLV